MRRVSIDGAESTADIELAENGARVTLIAGAAPGFSTPTLPPPPDSYARDARSAMLVLTIKRGCAFVPDEAALRRELPAGIALTAPPRVVPSSLGLQDVWYSVRRTSAAPHG